MKKISLFLLFMILFSNIAFAGNIDVGVSYLNGEVGYDIENTIKNSALDIPLEAILLELNGEYEIDKYIINLTANTKLSQQGSEKLTKNDKLATQDGFLTSQVESEYNLDGFNSINANLSYKMNEFYSLKVGYLQENIEISTKSSELSLYDPATKTTTKSSLGDSWLEYSSNYSMPYLGFRIDAPEVNGMDFNFNLAYSPFAKLTDTIKHDKYNQETEGEATGSSGFIEANLSKKINQNWSIVGKAKLLFYDLEGDRDYQYYFNQLDTDAQQSISSNQLQFNIAAQYNF